MKKRLIIGIFMITALTLSACGGGNSVSKSEVVVGSETSETSTEVSTESDDASTESGNTSQQTALEEQSGDNGLKPIEFSTVDLNGNAISMEDFSDSKLIMVNFWEYWCPPCKQEMPDIQKLYENYKDQGFAVLGVISTPQSSGDAKEVADSSGVKYPTIYITESLLPFLPSGVPTTYFMDPKGNILNPNDPVIGALDYDGWEKIIKSFFN